LLRSKERALQRKRADGLKGQDERQVKAEMDRAHEEERLASENKAKHARAERAAVLELFENAECSGMAETGIAVKVERRGAIITALRSGTSAAASEFKQGDIISQIGDDLVSGFGAYEILARLRGRKGSTVEIVASRVSENAKTRVSDLVERDVSLPPLQGEPGVSLKAGLSGASVTTVYEATSADEEGLQPGDVISMVDGEFVAGMELNDVAEKVRGLAGTQVDVVVMRTKDGVKSRVEFKLVRDHNLTPMPVRSIFDRATVGL
jgi:C-terminal processing protease CtpA/Prc